MDSGTGDPVWRSDAKALPIGVIAALELEGRIAAPAIRPGSGALHVSGPGAGRAFAAAKRAIAGGARGLVSFGLAGGLTPAAATASVLLPESGSSRDFHWSADDGWHARLRQALETEFPLVRAPLYSADRVLTTVREKSDAATSSGAVAVDMESASIARAAEESELPFVALRVVADGPGDALPVNVAALVTGDGRTRYAGLAGFVLAPDQLSLLIRLANRSGKARRALRRVIAALMREA